MDYIAPPPSLNAAGCSQSAPSYQIINTPHPPHNPQGVSVAICIAK